MNKKSIIKYLGYGLIIFVVVAFGMQGFQVFAEPITYILELGEDTLTGTAIENRTILNKGDIIEFPLSTGMECLITYEDVFGNGWDAMGATILDHGTPLENVYDGSVKCTLGTELLGDIEHCYISRTRYYTTSGVSYLETTLRMVADRIQIPAATDLSSNFELPKYSTTGDTSWSDGTMNYHTLNIDNPLYSQTKYMQDESVSESLELYATQ